MPQHYTSDRATLLSGLRGAFPGAADGDIMRLCELVLSAAACTAEADLLAIMLEVKAINKQKEGVRDSGIKMSAKQRSTVRQLVDPTARARATIAVLVKQLDTADGPPWGDRG